MNQKRICILLSLVFLLPALSFGESTGASFIPNDYFSGRDLSGEWDEKEAVEMLLNGSVTISEAGIYILSGCIEDGTVTVRAGKDDKVQLVLNNVSITSSSSAAILVEKADKVFITLPEGTQNTLRSTGFDEGSSVDAALYAKDDLIFNGKGTLTVESALHGIVGKDAVKFAGGSYQITAGERGISAKGSVRIADGSFFIRSGKDAIRAKNEKDIEKGYVIIFGGTFDLHVGGGSENGETHTDDLFGGRGPWNSAASDSEEDTGSAKGLKASGSVILAGGKIMIDSADDAVHSDREVIILDGTELTIRTGDDAIHSDDILRIDGGVIRILLSYEGLEAFSITVNGGDIEILSEDDGLNAAGDSIDSGPGWNNMFVSDGSSIVINGGSLYVNASGDGIDSNGDLTVNGGILVVSGPTNSMNGALDANGEMTVNGGTVAAAGAVGMAETFSSSSSQVSFMTNLSGTGGEAITVTDENGRVLLSCMVEKNFSCVVISSPDLRIGETYTVTSGGSSIPVTVTGISSDRNGGFGGPGGGRKPGGW